MSDPADWYNFVYRSVTWPESADVVLEIRQIAGAPEAIRSAWALGGHAGVRGAVAVLLEWTALGERVVKALKRERAKHPEAFERGDA